MFLTYFPEEEISDYTQHKDRYSSSYGMIGSMEGILWVLGRELLLRLR